ncbi:MAG: hypothetical protein U9R02_10010 [Thermodesulfobacteriota bacterium]|nr:hypothetical protein [Thermodesulfobacteriota bacterium]
MENNINIQPSKKVKIFFWIILGALSVFFAEVVSGSDMFPFFRLWGLLMELPLYTLHILVLSYIVFNYGKPRFYTLFIAGAIFGMYEAYLTKVLWAPPWGNPIISVAGIAVIEVILLALFWHPFMSFIIPLFVGENILTNSRKITKGLPNRMKKLFNTKKKNYILLVLLAILFGIFQSTNSPSPLHSLLSGLSTTAVLILLIYLWRTKTKGKEYNIQMLLPNKKEFSVLLVLLIIMYVIMGMFIRPEALPGLEPQMIIWAIYAGLFILLFLHLRKSRKTTLPKTISSPINFSWKVIVTLSLLFATSSASSKFLMGDFRDIIMLMFWSIDCAIGILILFLSIRDLFHRAKTCESE